MCGKIMKKLRNAANLVPNLLEMGALILNVNSFRQWYDRYRKLPTPEEGAKTSLDAYLHTTPHKYQ